MHTQLKHRLSFTFFLDNFVSKFSHLWSFLFSFYFATLRYRYDMSVEEAAELATRSIYHATFRDGASGGVASGTSFVSISLCSL